MCRRVLKWFAASAALALLLGLGFVINLVWFRPFSLNLFYDRLLVEQMLASPETTTAMGIAKQYGWRRHDAHLDDLSLAKEQRDMARVRRNLATLQAYDFDRQSSAQQLTTRILRWKLQAQVDGQKFHHHDYPVQQVNGVHIQLLDFLIRVHQIDDRRGAQDFLARLDEVPRKFDQLIEQLQAREQEGIVPPRFVIERVLTQLRAFEGKYVRDNPLYVHFAERLPVILTGRETDVLALLNECASLIQTRVRPAYRKLIAFFDGQLKRAGSDDGVWKLPDGDAYYAWRLRMETTTNLTPQQVHDLGLAEVARIEGQMRTASDPSADLGRLQAELYRAVPLVVDTGIHYKRWPRQQAIDYLLEKTGKPLASVVSEVERYIVMPGQACSDKIGMLSIQAAQRRAELALGDRWHTEAEKAFHDKVLAMGSVPLEVLDEQVDAWVKTRLAR